LAPGHFRPGDTLRLQSLTQATVRLPKGSLREDSSTVLDTPFDGRVDDEEPITIYQNNENLVRLPPISFSKSKFFVQVNGNIVISSKNFHRFDKKIIETIILGN
jgi:hypothetical protein